MSLEKLLEPNPHPETPFGDWEAIEQKIKQLKEEKDRMEGIEIKAEVKLEGGFPALPEPLDVTPKKVKVKSKSNGSAPLEALQTWIEDVAKSGIGEEKVRQIIAEELSTIPPRVIEVKDGDKSTKIEGLTHFQFELVLKAVSSGVNLAMTGPAATSKTTMAIQVAKALGKEYMVFRPLHSPSQAEGYNSAIGEYIQSNLYRAHKEGKLAIFDEFDASDPAITLVINSILDNKTFTYPNGETVTNEGFQIICTMNTKGTGSDRKFVGRNRLDAATLDRFVVLEVQQDETLEAAIIGITEKQRKLDLEDGSKPSALEWLTNVRSLRESYRRSHPDKIVSLRAVRDGWKLISQGIGLNWALKMCVHK